MNYIIKEAKTVDEAIEDALLELNVKREDVEIEVLEEASKGILGLIGVKDAKVKVTVVKNLAKLAQEFLDKLIKSMDIIAEVDVVEEADKLLVEISEVNPRDKGILIGKRGNTLDSLQYLLSLHINKDNDQYKKVILDIEGYREKREQTLIRLAQRMAEKAIKNKRVVKLEPMNPYERRIIHSSLQDYEGVTTYSEGRDPYRRIVIQAK